MNTMPVTAGLLQKQDIAFSFYSKSHDNLLVSAFAVEETIFGLTNIEVMLVSDNPKIDLSAFIDEPATLIIHHRYLDQRRYFSGIVVEAERGDTGHHKTAYRVVMLPALYRLDNSADCRIFQNQSIPDIIAEILSENRIDRVEWKIGQYDKREYVVQYNETHLAFIERIMAEEGIFYYFRHDAEGRHTLVISDDPFAGEDCPGQKELDYNALASGAAKGVWCSSLKYREKLRATRYIVQDYTFKNPKAQLQHTSALSKTGEKQDYPIFEYPGRFKTDKNGEKYSQLKIDATRVDASLLHGVANAPLLITGHHTTITGHPDKEMNAKWRLLTLRHEGIQPQVLGEDGQGELMQAPDITAPDLLRCTLAGLSFGTVRSKNPGLLSTLNRGGLGLALAKEGDGNSCVYACAFTANLFETAYRPPQTAKPVVDGPQIAHVVGPEGEEIFTDEHGRVKVHFPWDRHHDRQAQDSSCWLRVSSPWAGATWGNVSIPRVGQEVIVDFLEGDPDQPIITGRTYHAANKSPYPLPANKTKMVIRSETHKSSGGAPKFNEISFEDENGQENLFIHAQKDQTVKVLNDRAKRVEANEVQSIGQNRSMEVGANAQEKIGGSLNRFVGGGGTSLLGLLGGVLAAGMKDAETGSENVGIPALSQFAQGAAASTVAGEMQSLAANGAFNAAGGHYTQGGVTMAGTGTALGGLLGSIMPLSGVVNTVIEKFQTDTIGIARSEQIGSYKNTSVGHTMTINVAEELIIKVGKSRFIMDKEGHVTLVGVKFNFTAEEDVRMNGKVIDLN